jgi:hypothetical protein
MVRYAALILMLTLAGIEVCQTRQVTVDPSMATGRLRDGPAGLH